MMVVKTINTTLSPIVYILYLFDLSWCNVFMGYNRVMIILLHHHVCWLSLYIYYFYAFFVFYAFFCVFIGKLALARNQMTTIIYTWEALLNLFPTPKPPPTYYFWKWRRRSVRYYYQKVNIPASQVRCREDRILSSTPRMMYHFKKALFFFIKFLQERFKIIFDAI